MLRIEAGAKLLRGAKRRRAQTDRRHQFGNRVQDCLIVVDNENRGFCHAVISSRFTPAG